tara:strand:+ start:1386 stop:1538 length:153 start_codon:yes stop_codon:yes gene_type:complete
MKRKRNVICGIKITTPPIPDIIPWESKSVKIPGGRVLLIKLLKEEKPESM